MTTTTYRNVVVAEEEEDPAFFDDMPPLEAAVPEDEAAAERAMRWKPAAEEVPTPPAFLLPGELTTVLWDEICWFHESACDKLWEDGLMTSSSPSKLAQLIESCITVYRARKCSLDDID
jgi:hypothetical protein